ncbi:hypothetical protein HORIV_54310 [Vreelandella olivaria]|uniref:Uncharacterized protein n=1 Tax=Vreelandella olivaria TaxID=390919 RepID=A0ABM7GQJ0_9GAMM|nr:hypothetical protein HORIV_54310 [Halomonas olivaria]
MVILYIFIALILLILINVPVAVALALVGTIATFMTYGNMAMPTVGMTMFEGRPTSRLSQYRCLF